MSKQKRFEGILAWVLTVVMSVTLIPFTGGTSYAGEEGPQEPALSPEEVTEENVMTASDGSVGSMTSMIRGVCRERSAEAMSTMRWTMSRRSPVRWEMISGNSMVIYMMLREGSQPKHLRPLIR